MSVTRAPSAWASTRRHRALRSPRRRRHAARKHPAARSRYAREAANTVSMSCRERWSWKCHRDVSSIVPRVTNQGARRAPAPRARTSSRAMHVRRCANSHHAEQRFDDRIGLDPARRAARIAGSVNMPVPLITVTSIASWIDARKRGADFIIGQFVRTKRLGDFDDLHHVVTGAAPVGDGLVGQPLRVRGEEAEPSRAKRRERLRDRVACRDDGKPPASVVSSRSSDGRRRQQPIGRTGEPDRDRPQASSRRTSARRRDRARGSGGCAAPASCPA